MRFLSFSIYLVFLLVNVVNSVVVYSVGVGFGV